MEGRTGRAFRFPLLFCSLLLFPLLLYHLRSPPATGNHTKGRGQERTAWQRGESETWPRGGEGLST